MAQNFHTNTIPLQMVHPYPMINQTVIEDMTPTQLEDIFNATLANCKQLAKSTTVTQDVIMAKMVHYCIRMLHSENWVGFSLDISLALQ